MLLKIIVFLVILSLSNISNANVDSCASKNRNSLEIGKIYFAHSASLEEMFFIKNSPMDWYPTQYWIDRPGLYARFNRSFGRMVLAIEHSMLNSQVIHDVYDQDASVGAILGFYQKDFNIHVTRNIVKVKVKEVGEIQLNPGLSLNYRFAGAEFRKEYNVAPGDQYDIFSPLGYKSLGYGINLNINLLVLKHFNVCLHTCYVDYMQKRTYEMWYDPSIHFKPLNKFMFGKVGFGVNF